MIRGKNRNIIKSSNSDFYAGLHNRFDIEVTDSRTGKIRQKAKAENVICDSFWTRWFGNNSAVGYIHYGSGSGTPSTSDTSLFNFVKGVGWTDNVWDTTHYAEGYLSIRNSITLNETTSVGVTITEVGIGYSASSTSLTTHAMLRDMNGNPISIEKTDTDIITIYATRFLHWNPNGYNGVKVLPHLLTDAWLGNKTPTGSFGASKRRGISGTMALASTVRDVSTKTITYKFERMPVETGNNKGLLWFTMGPFVVEAPHTKIVGESVGTGDGTTTDFAVAFEMPYDATVYVDGVAQTSGVTVYPELVYADAGNYMEGINSDSTEELLKFNGYGPSGSGDNYYYNPFHELGITKCSGSRVSSLCSDDLKTWSIPTFPNYSKYWNIYYTGAWYDPAGELGAIPFASHHNGKAIHFDSPPPAGSVITIDYTASCLAKDSDHVYDFQYSVTLGAYDGS